MTASGDGAGQLLAAAESAQQAADRTRLLLAGLVADAVLDGTRLADLGGLADQLDGLAATLLGLAAAEPTWSGPAVTVAAS